MIFTSIDESEYLGHTWVSLKNDDTDLSVICSTCGYRLFFSYVIVGTIIVPEYPYKIGDSVSYKTCSEVLMDEALK